MRELPKVGVVLLVVTHELRLARGAVDVVVFTEMASLSRIAPPRRALVMVVVREFNNFCVATDQGNLMIAVPMALTLCRLSWQPIAA